MTAGLQPWSLLPLEPMIPILNERIPHGDDWGFQIKWDGVRLLAGIEDGRVELYSRSRLNKNAVYPELVERLAAIKHSCILDGEAVVFDPILKRPVFQYVLQRERTGTRQRSSLQTPATYAIFDLLLLDGRDLRGLGYQERHRILQELLAGSCGEQLICTDLFKDGEALWQWVSQHGWEGIVSKRLSAPYKAGKHHQDAFKKKTAIVQDVKIVALVLREGRIASLVTALKGAYFGKVSLGLNEQSKRKIAAYAASLSPAAEPVFGQLPADLKKDRLLWLQRPFNATVSGLEITAGGVLRHPKLLRLELPQAAVEL